MLEQPVKAEARCIGSVVDDCHFAARYEVFPHFSEVACRIIQVVVYVPDEDQIQAAWMNGSRKAPDRHFDQLGEALCRAMSFDVAQELLVDVDGIYFTILAHDLGEPEREIPPPDPMSAIFCPGLISRLLMTPSAMPLGPDALLLNIFALKSSIVVTPNIF